MFGVILSRWFLLLGVIFYTKLDHCSWAAVPKPTRLRVRTSVSKSDSLVISGDKVRFNLLVEHGPTSQVKAVDAVLKIKFPFFLIVNSFETGNGLSPTTQNNTSGTFNLKFAEIPLAEIINVTVIIDVDPHFMRGSRETVILSTDVNLWYYGEEGPCSRPPSYYNAHHEERRWMVEFLASKACEQRIESTLGIPIFDDQYFASSVSPDHKAHLASLSNPGAWLPANSFKGDRNQFLQIDFKRLVKITKIAIRGMTSPFIAFVRTYHLYFSNNLIEWFGYQENHKLKTFNGNTDGTRLVASYLPLPTNARYVRIVPRTWKSKQALQLQVYGCPVHPVTTLTDYCPLFDFESPIDGWTKTGTAFDNQPTIGDNFRARTKQSANIQGQGWIATAENRGRLHLLPGDTQGDEPIGTLMSPKFFIATSKLYFLIGGTADSAKARAELLVDGVVVRDTCGDGETLSEKEWNVGEFIGKEAVLRLVDDAADGHLNFDALRIDCHLDADAEDIPLPTRSILLNPSTHSLYICDSTHLSHKDDSRCRMTSNNIDKWIDVPDVLGILGVDKSSNKLYAVSNDRHVLVSLRRTGREWEYITRSQWDEAKVMPTMLLAREVVWQSSMDGLVDDTTVELSDNNGEKWKANSSGVSFKGAGPKPYIPIASWYCQVSDIPDDPCVSEPCQNNAKCKNTSPRHYYCLCQPGYTGSNCDGNVDDCVNHDCLNGGTCLDGLNTFTCSCKYGYGGKKCDIELSPCRTFPCLNGGTCTNTGSGYFKCTCPPKYRGTTCEIVSDKCETFPCKNGGECISGDNSYQCLCSERFYGTNCGNVRYSHFTIISTRSITSTYEYLVIKATIPSHGQSLWQNWCIDYEQLCISQSGRRPTGVGLSYNNDVKHTSCQDNYNSFMDPSNVLGANPADKVAELAQSAGFLDATPSNSFAFNMCSEKNCSKTLPETGCDTALSCINRAVQNYQVYTVCTYPDANFQVYHREWTTYNGFNFLLLVVRIIGSYSKHENWCRDYEKLCKSYGLRATGADGGTCQQQYNSLVFKNLDRSSINNAAKKIKPVSYSFNFKDCSTCNRYYYNSRDALYYITSYKNMGTVCAKPEGVGFKILDDKSITIDGIHYVVLKAKVPEDGISKGSNWCQDVQTLCESYGKKSIGCGACPTKYQSLIPDRLTCPLTSGVKQLANDAGFTEATMTNSLVLNNCNDCSARISHSASCKVGDFFCLSADNVHRVVYTVCSSGRSRSTAFKVLDTKRTIYANTPYLVIKTLLPQDRRYRLLNWCQDYQELCESYGTKPTGCGQSYSGSTAYSSCRDSYGSVMPSDNHLGCNNSHVPHLIAKKADFASASTSNTFVFHQCSDTQCSTYLSYNCESSNISICSCHPSLGCLNTTIPSASRYGYVVCVGERTAFKVLETKQTTGYNGDDVFVVKASLPSNGVARNEDWCEDYRLLCLDHGWRPTGCGSAYTDLLGYTTCRSRYHSVMPEDNIYGCPPNYEVSRIANVAGFNDANAGNSFAFSDCSTSCSKTLNEDNQFINITASQVYTICVTSNSNFKVTSNKEMNFNGGQYLFIQAEVPSDYNSKHVEWCKDYQSMCESFGLRPVGRHGNEGSQRYSSCITKHGAVNPMREEATNQGLISVAAAYLGYTSSQPGNTFILDVYCHSSGCHKHLSFYSNSYKGLHYLNTDTISKYFNKVYTVCASSDSNFHVLSNKTITYNDEDYLVVMATLPSNRESKYESWCKDYERLCRTFKMRPTGCSISYQSSIKYWSCVEKYHSAMANSETLGCNSSETIAHIANMAGFSSASPSNSFVFHQCSEEDSCPRKLTKDCAQGLSCLNNQSHVVYTLCTDSASAFTVEYARESRDRYFPLLLIGSSLPADPKPKRLHWCRDYKRLCISFGAKPTCCEDKKDHYKSCKTRFGAIRTPDELQGCENNGDNDIQRLVHATRGLDNGIYFKYHKCKIDICKGDIGDTTCHGALHCFKKSYFVYTTCSRSTSNFAVLTTISTSYEEMDDILVIKALVPSDGVSLHDTWCHDYEKVCAFYGKQPLACPLRSDYLQESRYRSCRKDFNGYMMENPKTPCPLNDIVAQIANEAGFAVASPENSFALSSCDSCSNTLNFVKTTDTLTLSLSSCPAGAICANWSSSSDVVHLLCVQPPQVSSFLVQEVRQVTHEGNRFSVFRLKSPTGDKSRFDNWCTDYQKLCESVAMRPIGCGIGNEHRKEYRDCRIKYNAVMLPGFGCSPRQSIIDVVRKAGFPINHQRTFGMYGCLTCNSDLKESLNDLDHTDGYLYTACTNSDSAFDVMETRNVVVSDTSFLVIKAQLPVNLLSAHESWCKDYQMLCESYGKRPLSCPGACSRSLYNMLSVDSLVCGDASNLNSVPLAANFTEATSDNTFILRSCGVSECMRRIPDTRCTGGLGCLTSAVPNREVYTMCISSTTAYDVIASKPYTYNSQTYLVIRVKIPSDGTSRYSSWCDDYKEMCQENGYRPITTCPGSYCVQSHDAIYQSGYVCPVSSHMTSIASNAMDYVTDDTNFAYSSCKEFECKKVAYFTDCAASDMYPINCYDRTLNDGEFTTMCINTVDSAFPVLEYKTVSYSGRNYVIVRTEKRKLMSKKNNWCFDYTELCKSFHMLPLACPEKQGTHVAYNYCGRKYMAVMMDNVHHACPLNNFVSELAQLAGFTSATPANSFAFQNCSNTHCTKTLTEDECHEALPCLNTKDNQEDLYTACTNLDSAFKIIDYKADVSYNYQTYAIIKVSASFNKRSLHEDWCRDYQRLCESIGRRPVSCYDPGDKNTPDVCTESYGAYKAFQCGNTARSVAAASGFNVQSNKVFVMRKCIDCPKTMTRKCWESLDCARSGVTQFAICADQHHSVSGVALKPLQTRRLTYGVRSFIVVQTKLTTYSDSDWEEEYVELCNMYGYIPIGCGKTASDSDSNIRSCLSSYEMVSSEGDDFSCPPSDTIAMLARKVGFYEANKMNTFALYKCSASASTYLSASYCYTRVWCMKRSTPRNILYTMCAKPRPSTFDGFQVLDKKKVAFLHTNYIALKVKISVDGNSSLDNWCYDYRELCRQYNAVPTGCGNDKESDAAYSSCKTKYNSFMTYRCTSNKMPVTIVRKAGFRDANQANTFVFNRCEKCAKSLTGSDCDGALHCLHNWVWEKIAYTLCVERSSGFEVLSKSDVAHGKHEVTVIEAALPEDRRAVHENWCQDYQKLCYSLGMFPIACSIDANTPDLKKYAGRFGAVILDNIPCSPVSTIVNIAKTAGYTEATFKNTFIFGKKAYSACPKYMLSNCIFGLDCVSSKWKVVYTICTNPTAFDISDIRTAMHVGNTFSVIKARLPVTGLSKAATWCDEYAKLCRVLKQQPVGCQGVTSSLDYEKCNQVYDAYSLTDKYNCSHPNSFLHEIAHVAGFPEASFGNTFGMKSCSAESCKQEIHSGLECDPSLNCVNSKTPNRQVFAICIKDGEISNFEVKEMKQVKTSDVLYLAVRALIPPYGESKYETWCKDYERMCSANEMRPVRCSSHQNRNCLGKFNAFTATSDEFDCTNNAKLAEFVKSVGFEKASSDNTFVYGPCESTNLCRKTLDLASQCDSSLNCLKHPSGGSREVYTLCARTLTTGFRYRAARQTYYQGSHYLVIKASPSSNRMSVQENWCYDFRDMCASFGKQPLVTGRLYDIISNVLMACFTKYNGTSTPVSQTQFSNIAKAAGFNSGNCANTLNNCRLCSKSLQGVCPFITCNCKDMYLICL